MLQSQALAILESGANVFLTGAPGAGKTYILNEFIRRSRSRGARVALTASTGIAATHINGQTIHSFSGIGVANVLTDSLIKRIKPSRKRAIEAVDILVIDEISMLHAWMFDMVDQVCRIMRRDPRPFGGLQVVISGDLYQLPPVSTRAQNLELLQSNPEYVESRQAYAQAGRDPEGFVTQSLVWPQLNPQVCYLTEQHRQDNGELLNVLTHIRQGAVDSRDELILGTRVGITPREEDVTVRLFPVNKQADQLNDARLDALDEDEHVFTATSSGQASLVEQLKKNMLAPKLLRLKTGAAVMALRNDADKQYVNGSLGTVTGFVSESKGGWPIVSFENGNRVVMKPQSWDMMDGETVLASVSQVPLRCAWAITIHKSQGMSLERAAMDLSRTFAPGMGYVALSRVQSLEGLYIAGINSRAYSVSDEAVRLDSILRARSQAIGNLLETRGDEGLRELVAREYGVGNEDDEFSQDQLF